MANGQANTRTVVVGILSLQVILAPDGDSWIAQSVELDYASSGDSLEDAKKRFEDGLHATIDAHLKRFGSLDRFLEQRPRTSDWLELMTDGAESQRYTRFSKHRFVPQTHDDGSFPFGEISYFAPPGYETGA